MIRVLSRFYLDCVFSNLRFDCFVDIGDFVEFVSVNVLARVEQVCYIVKI